MLKIGVIGLGDIAQKAYLPVLSKKKIEVHLCTRDTAKLSEIGLQYRFSNLHGTLDSLINSGIHAAFIHTATTSHHDIAERLLNNNIHVYIDKPITYDYASSEKLLTLAAKKKLVLMVGFNRRYAPAIQNLKTLRNPSMIIMQKNRKSLPGDVRTFIFDDFIHVVDTLLYMFPHQPGKLTVAGKKQDNQLYHVVVQLESADGHTAIGIMNRDSGTTEEKLEVFTNEEKRIVYNVTDTIVYKDKSEIRLGVNDWESTLYKRGFEGIVDEFIKSIDVESSSQYSAKDSLLTHEICEEIVKRLAED